MKKFRIALPMFALVLAIAASAFTLHKPVAPKATSLYWYRVTYDAGHPNGVIQNSADFYVQDDKANVSSPCASGASKDCLRGFGNQLSSFPNTNIGMDQIKKP